MTNSAMMHVPTISERFWRKMGFRYHLGDEPEGTEKMVGWMQTTARLDFSLLDRLRLLFTGRLRVVLSIHTDGKVYNAISRIDYEIKYPGQK